MPRGHCEGVWTIRRPLSSPQERLNVVIHFIAGRERAKGYLPSIAIALPWHLAGLRLGLAERRGVHLYGYIVSAALRERDD